MPQLSVPPALSLAATLFIAGCASMQGIAPQSSVRDTNALAAARSLEGARISPAAWPQHDWWVAYRDPQLSALIEEALKGSPTLNIAAARTRKALAFAASARANELPRVDANASSTRQHFSEHGLLPPPLGGSTQTINQLQATLSWEIDFWGRNRSASEAAL